jgi:serine/threonine-protein kinase RsbW
MTSHLRIHCSRQNLQQARDFVRHFLSVAQSDERVVNQVVLAIDEVVANFIIHANGEQAEQFLDLFLALEGRRLEVEIEDHGPTVFAPALGVPALDIATHLQQGKRGGLGLVLVERLVDQIAYSVRNAHTVCHLSKMLH